MAHDVSQAAVWVGMKGADDDHLRPILSGDGYGCDLYCGVRVALGGDGYGASQDDLVLPDGESIGGQIERPVDATLDYSVYQSNRRQIVHDSFDNR